MNAVATYKSHLSDGQTIKTKDNSIQMLVFRYFYNGGILMDGGTEHPALLINGCLTVNN